MANDVGSRSVRATSAMPAVGLCFIGRYTCFFGSRSSPWLCTSPTTPTTSALAVRILDDLAERAAIREIPPRHRLVDHAGPRCLLAIALVEESAREQLDLHRLEVAGRDDADVGERIFGGRRLLSFDVERQRAGGADVVQRHRRHRGGVHHAGRAAQALDHVLVEAHLRRALILRRRQQHARGDEVGAIEAGTHLQQLREAARHQSGADEQHQRERDLDHDQSAQHVGARMGCRCCRTIRACCRADPVATRAAPGSSPKASATPIEITRREQQHAAIELDVIHPRQLALGQRPRAGAVRRTATTKSEHAAGERQQQALGEDRPRHFPACSRRARRAPRSRAGGSTAAPAAGWPCWRRRSAAGIPPRPSAPSAPAATRRRVVRAPPRRARSSRRCCL